jgi:hypothetical protein
MASKITRRDFMNGIAIAVLGVANGEVIPEVGAQGIKVSRDAYTNIAIDEAYRAVQ